MGSTATDGLAGIQALMNNMIDGLLICHTLHTDTFEHLRMQMNKRIPIVQFYRVAEDLAISRIHADDEAGAEAVTEHHHQAAQLGASALNDVANILEHGSNPHWAATAGVLSNTSAAVTSKLIRVSGRQNFQLKSITWS